MRGLLLDFNGTLSDDEHLLCEIFQDLFEQEGKPLSADEYYDRLAGLSDEEIVEHWLGRRRPDVVERKIAEYRARIPMYEPIDYVVAATLREVARLVPIAIVSGSARAEIELVLENASLLTSMAAIVAAEDVAHGKPHPEGYRRALHLVRLSPEDCAAIEDSDVGVAAAKAAGIYCVAVTTTMGAERLAAADLIVDRVDEDLIRRLVSSL